VAVLTGILLLSGAHGAGPDFEVDEEFVLRVDGDQGADAKIFRGRRGLLLEIPSEATLFLVDRDLGTVFAVRKDQVERVGDRRRLVTEQFAWSAPLSYEGGVIRFHTGVSEIRLVPAEPKPAEENAAGSEVPAPAAPEPRKSTDPGPPTAEVLATPAVLFAADPVPACGDATDGGPPSGMPGAVARDCLSLETRPAAGVPGCTRFVYIRNHCETTVVAQVQRIERLMSGTLPQVFNVTVGREEWLGCAWWGGAMAPAQHDILGASFLDTRPRRAAGARKPGR
jgi:hypothetical protein